MKSYAPMKPTPEGTDSLSGRVYRHLKAALREGRLHLGTWLDQDSLCAELGVSRTPLRDALLRLEAEGFVSIQPRKGVFIPPVTDAFVKSACQLAGALEADCLDAVFPLITPRLLRRMEEASRRQELLVERRRLAEFREEDARFHELFLSLSDNELMRRTLNPLRRRLGMLPEHPFTMEQAEALVADHRRIIESLRMDNRVAAVSILRHEHWSPLRYLCPKSAKLPRLVPAKNSAA